MGKFLFNLIFGRYATSDVRCIFLSWGLVKVVTARAYHIFAWRTLWYAMCVSFLLRLLLIIAVAQSCTCPSRTINSICTFGSSCVILPAGFSQKSSVRWAISHSSRQIVTFSRSLYPCGIFISASDWSFLTIVAVSAGSHLQEIRYQKRFFRLRLPPVLNSFFLEILLYFFHLLGEL